MVIDNLKLYRSMNLDTSILGAIDAISSGISDNFIVNPTPNTIHRFKMKTKRLRKKLYKNPHRYYDKTFADMLVYARTNNEAQLKFMEAMRNMILYGDNGSRLTNDATDTTASPHVHLESGAG